MAGAAVLAVAAYPYGLSGREKLPAMVENPAMFPDRFHDGVAEKELRDWLKANDFTIGTPATAASRLYSSSWLCPTRVTAEWTTDGHSILKSASIRAIGEGCP